MPRGNSAAALQLVSPSGEEKEPPPGDPTLTREALAGWKEGQRKCRTWKRHRWGPYTVFEHKMRGTKNLRYEVVERCTLCGNRRTADFVQTSYGLRMVDRWKMDYRDGYLLPKGAQRIGEELHDELVAQDILSRKVIEVLDDEEDDQ